MQIKFTPPSSQPSNPLRKVSAFIVTLALAGVALMFSAVLLAFILIVAVVGGAVLWWKTRAIRKQMRAQMQGFAPRSAAIQREAFAGEIIKGEVIEGEVIRVDERRAEYRRSN